MHGSARRAPACNAEEYRAHHYVLMCHSISCPGALCLRMFSILLGIDAFGAIVFS